jgi:hypothetical protein|tara:strand:- start:588 stop:863 length:276 start_codon:yes stop_codon:yes gene_type:complete
MNQRITNEKRVIPEGVKMICKTHNKLFYTNEEIERHTKRALKQYEMRGGRNNFGIDCYKLCDLEHQYDEEEKREVEAMRAEIKARKNKRGN